jgi:hypothetical protein
MVTRLKMFLVFMVVAVLAAGLFGALHDQISYTISSDYFTWLKFGQFGVLNTAIPVRLRVALVGFLATWWMGMPLGYLTGLAVFIHRTDAQARRALTWSLAVIAGFTLAFSLGGLLYGMLTINTPAAVRALASMAPVGVTDVRDFLWVGSMHDAAYLGGILAVPAAWVFHLAYRYRHRDVA